MFWIGLGLAWFAGLVSTIQSDIERAFNRKVETVNEEQDGKTCPEEVSVRTPFPSIFVIKSTHLLLSSSNRVISKNITSPKLGTINFR